MKYKFGKISKQNLDTCHLDLQLLAREVLAMGLIDFAVLWGHRDKTNQNNAYNSIPKKSNAKWPKSKHNKNPSDAFDLAPWINGRIPWQEDDKDYWAWYYLGGAVMAAAKKLSIDIVWGKVFKKLKDLGHFEKV